MRYRACSGCNGLASRTRPAPDGRVRVAKHISAGWLILATGATSCRRFRSPSAVAGATPLPGYELNEGAGIIAATPMATCTRARCRWTGGARTFFSQRRLYAYLTMNAPNRKGAVPN